MVRFLCALFLLFFSCVPLHATGQSGRGERRIAAPPRVSPPQRQLVILDPGHGGFDIGAMTQTIQEKVLALQTAKLVKKYLHQKGYRVVLTRSRDTFISLSTRTAIANDTKSKLFVSIHYNAFKNPKVNGIEVYYYNKGPKGRQNASKKLAQYVLDKMVATTGASNRGVKTGNFHVIRETKMPAILIEGGFITNPQEHAHLSDQKYIETMARSIAQSIERYFKG